MGSVRDGHAGGEGGAAARISRQCEGGRALPGPTPHGSPGAEAPDEASHLHHKTLGFPVQGETEWNSKHTSCWRQSPPQRSPWECSRESRFETCSTGRRRAAPPHECGSSGRSPRNWKVAIRGGSAFIDTLSRRTTRAVLSRGGPFFCRRPAPTPARTAVSPISGCGRAGDGGKAPSGPRQACISADSRASKAGISTLLPKPAPIRIVYGPAIELGRS